MIGFAASRHARSRPPPRRTSARSSAIWHDARPTLGHSVELLQRNDFLIGLYARIAQSAEGWDGSDPLRAMSDIARAG